MRVLVTGGTGFVGSHSVAALERAGHHVRLLARSPERVRPALAPHGVDDVEVLVGDCTDPVAVRTAVDGCDALLHCANVFTWDASRQKGLVDTNTRTTETVLGEATSKGLDPVVHVSSYVALLPADRPLSPDTPVGSLPSGYASSKAAAERAARRLQESGAPVVTTYPGAVLGPHDPYRGDSNELLVTFLASRRPPAVGLLGVVDVRDVAAAHAALMAPGRGPRRLILTGHDVPMHELARRTGRAAGVDVRPVRLPSGPTRRIMGAVDLVARTLRISTFGSGPVDVVSSYPGGDMTPLAELGVALRPLDDTLDDTVAWLRATGRLQGRRFAAASP